MQFKLGGVSPNGLQIPPESFCHSAVTNRLIRGYQLKRNFALRNGSKKKNPWNLEVLTFGDLNNHKSLVKENVITSYPENIVEPKEADK